jgi:SAM-dependent methyltransferase
VSETIWHDLECGRYTEDLSLWLQLAAEVELDGQPVPVLDVGAGTGRVTLTLARARHAVVALDRSAELLAELERRAAGLPVETACADARDFMLGDRSFALIVVPMQTIQLLGGHDGHVAFLERARLHLRPGGLLAIAVAAAEDFEEFEWRAGDAMPLPDIAEIEGSAYFSQPTAVRRVGDAFVLERHREIVDPTGRRTSSADRIWLDVVSVHELQVAGAQLGLQPRGVRTIRATDEHIASEVVIFGD